MNSTDSDGIEMVFAQERQISIFWRKRLLGVNKCTLEIETPSDSARALVTKKE